MAQPLRVVHQALSHELKVAQSNEATIDRALRVLGTRHYQPKTVKAYIFWIKGFIEFNPTRELSELVESEVNEFLTDLAILRGVAAATQDQALCALLFLYERVLGRPLGHVEGVRLVAPSAAQRCSRSARPAPYWAS